MTVNDEGSNPTKIIKKETYIKSLWKNGQGQTSQIAIFPSSANFLDGDFLWRISSATMSHDNQFSIFKNCDRLLTVLSGAGIILNDKVVRPLDIIQFSGDDSQVCHLVKDEVVDVGIIFNRQKCSATMKVNTFTTTIDFVNECSFDGFTDHYFYCVTGLVDFENQIIRPGDTIYINSSLPFSNPIFKETSTFVTIEIRKKNDSARGSIDSIHPHRCPKCGQLSSSPIECNNCGIVINSFNNLAVQGVMSEDQVLVETLVVPPEDIERPFDSVFFNFKFNAWSLPLGFFLSYVFQKFWVVYYLAALFCEIPLHELGHAVSAWMVGYTAIPLGAIVPTAGLTLIGSERHAWVHLLYFGFFGYLAYKAWKQKVYFFVVLSSAFILISILAFSVLSQPQVSPFISFGGIAGEFFLAGVLILCFYQPSFQKIRWDFFRYPFFIMGCMSFVNATRMWIRIQNGVQAMPYGSAISSDGAADTNGDMNKLVAAGWTPQEIASRYLWLAKIMFTLILIQYIYSLFRSRSSQR